MLVGYAPRLMEDARAREVNVAYLFALSQFFMAWIVAGFYVRAALRWDREALRVLENLESTNPMHTLLFAQAKAPGHVALWMFLAFVAATLVVDVVERAGARRRRARISRRVGASRLAERPRHRRRLHERGEFPRHRGHDRLLRLRRLFVFRRLSRRISHGVLLIVAEPLRNIGKFTMADVLAFRMSPRPVRAMASLSTLTVSTFYMIAQMSARERS